MRAWLNYFQRNFRALHGGAGDPVLRAVTGEFSAQRMSWRQSDWQPGRIRPFECYELQEMDRPL